MCSNPVEDFFFLGFLCQNSLLVLLSLLCLPIVSQTWQLLRSNGSAALLQTLKVMKEKIIKCMSQIHIESCELKINLLGFCCEVYTIKII